MARDDSELEYLEVVEDSDDEPTEVPSDEDGTVAIETISAQFPRAIGLKFKNPTTGHFRALRVASGVMKPPEGGWSKYKFYVVYPKGDKREASAVVAAPSGYDMSGYSHHDDYSTPAYKRSKMLTENTETQDLVVLGVPWRMSEEELRSHFEQFGNVVFLQIKKNSDTGRSRGYGFVRYETVAEQTACLVNKHNIDGRYIDVKIPDSGVKSAPLYSRKIHLKLPSEVSTAELRDYFSKSGEITEIFNPSPFKGYAFITFLDSGVAHHLYGRHTVAGKSVEVGTAAPKRKDEPREGGGGGGGGFDEQFPSQTSLDWNRRYYPNISGPAQTNAAYQGYGQAQAVAQQQQQAVGAAVGGGDALQTAAAAFALLASLGGGVGGVAAQQQPQAGVSPTTAAQTAAAQAYATGNYGGATY